MHPLNRRDFLAQGTSALLGAAALTSFQRDAKAAPTAKRPNILFIITDDQGLGDLSCSGNPVLKTPALDRLHDESVRFTRFNVSPVCSPTRACLMTGRYNYRTGVIDTYAGRSMMDPRETTLAQMLADAGYRTGIFGKWHLGDNYPMRPGDRGFQEALVHHGGGIAQPSDPEYFDRKDTYFDPVLQHNGAPIKTSGYCSDVFTDAALDFIADTSEKPFFAYVAYNAPHTPLQVKEEDAHPYLDAGLPEELAKLYGMIANMDGNVGRMLARLDENGLAQDTLVLFMTDNGAQQLGKHERFNADLRGWKGTVYDGGIHVPCFLRWPAGGLVNREVDRIAAHIDLAPTLLDICCATPPSPPAFDGKSLVPLLTGQIAAADWPDRTLFFQWHRGDQPEPFKNSAVRTQQWKLVDGKELYDMEQDLAETRDLAGEQPDLVQRLRAEYETWFQDVSASRGYAPVRIHIGNERQNPVTLSRQDWRGMDNWTGQDPGHWEVHVERAGAYAAELIPDPDGLPGAVHMEVGSVSAQAEAAAGATVVRLEGLHLPAGDAQVRCWVEKNGKQYAPRFVSLERK